jgi:biopolymer transport protein TolR
MAFSAGSAKGIKNDINVTPLVDVVLVLLIIFMVITPMLQRGKPVSLPKGTHPEAEEKDGDPLVLSVTSDKKLWIESNMVPEAKIEAELMAELVKQPGRKMMLKGDEALEVGEVRKMMDHAKKAGAKGIQLAIEVPKKK